MNQLLALAVAIAGGALVAYAGMLVISGALVGILSLLFGDGDRPGWAELIVGPVVVVGSLALGVATAWILWSQVRNRG